MEARPTPSSEAADSAQRVVGRVGRRAFIRLTAGGAVAGAIGLPLLLEACGGSNSSSAPATSSGAGGTASSPTVGLKYPTYVAFQGPKPDLDGTPEGIPPAYFAFPKELVKAVKAAPGKGGDMTSFTTTIGPPPPPVDQSPVWQEVNKQLNINLKLIIAANQQDTQTKLATLVASNDLPDTIYAGSGASPIANFPDFLAAQCQDLTPFLAGDAVKDYPNLANYPSFVWKGPGTVFGGKIYGLPIPRSPFGSNLMVHQEILDQVGAGQPKNADDLKRILMAVTRPQAGVWGIVPGSTITGLGAGPNGIFPQIFNAPLNWKLDSGGHLIKDWETQEFKAALGFARDLYAAGVYHPNTLTYTNVSADADFSAGKFALYFSTWNGFNTVYWPQALRLNPAAKMGAIAPFSFDGTSKPQYYLGPGNFGNTHFKKASSDRIKELLGVMNFFAAPFGTQEALLLQYGIKDSDYTIDAQGNPISNPKGFASAQVPWRFIADKPAVQYNTVNSADYAKVVHAAEMALAPVGVQDPTLSLYSATNGGAGVTARQAVIDGINAIVAGRSPLSSFDQLVQDWKTKAGDKIRGEYEAALAAAK